jgi:predicted TIM-barrel fold metal-dependent hydrolase
LSDIPEIIFDAWVNIPSRPEDAVPDPATARFLRHAQHPAYTKGGSFDDVLARYREKGISGGIITKIIREIRPPFFDMLRLDDELVTVMCEEVAGYIQQHPGMFHGSLMLDPRLGFEAARHVAIAADHGLSMVRIMPSLSNLAANDALCYPIYTAACERGLAVSVNVGVPGPRQPARYQEPMLLDEVALAFPDLKLVLAHVGHPWQEQVVALLNKHENTSLIMSGWAPKYVPKEIKEYMASSRGLNKVMWASDYPALNIERTLQEALEIEMRDEARENFMGRNLLRLLGPPAGWKGPDVI